MIGSLAAVPLPDAPANEGPRSALLTDPLQDRLFERGFEVPIVPWPHPPRRLIRVSAQLYNTVAQYEALAAALPKELAASAVHEGEVSR
jgi:isopenicillin-N epimerase